MHQVLVSGFSTIAGSVFIAYVNLGVDPRYLITSSVMSIPGAIAASKLRMPETKVPLSSGQAAVIDKGESDEEQAANLLHSYSLGAWFGLRVAGLIFCNVLVIVSLVHTIDGLLMWIGQMWGLERNFLTLEVSREEDMSSQLCFSGSLTRLGSSLHHLTLFSFSRSLWALTSCGL